MKGHTMNTMKMIGSMLMGATLIFSASFAQAQSLPKSASCADMPNGTLPVLVTLCGDTETPNVGSIPPNDFKKPADRDGLVGKVVAAAYKMAQGKPCDAYQKLRDYETALELLVLTAGTPKAKISESKGDQLKGDLNVAMDALAPLPCQ